MRSIKVKKQGFTLAELAIVMLLTTIITGLLVVFYSQSRLVLERGMQKTMLQQKVRLTSSRIVPKIASAFRLPPDPNADEDSDLFKIGILPIVFPEPHNDEDDGPPAASRGEDRIRLNVTREWARELMRLPIQPDDIFDPQAPLFAQLEIFFDTTVEQTGDPRLGVTGDVLMRAYFDNNGDGNFINETDPVLIASGLTDVSFLVYPDNRRIRLRVESRGFIENATSNGPGEETIHSQVYETDIYLPVYTNF